MSVSPTLLGCGHRMNPWGISCVCTSLKRLSFSIVATYGEVVAWLMAQAYGVMMVRLEEAGLRDWRARLLEGVEGDVLEIGSGTGLNLPHYGSGVRRLVVSEPDRHMRRRLEASIHRATGSDQGEVHDARAEPHLFPAESHDAGVKTLVLCSVPVVGGALGEERRGLCPEGRFVFLEHILPEDPRWQKRNKWIEPVWRRIAGNCHLTRRTDLALAGAGFDTSGMTRERMPMGAPTADNTVRGTAFRL